MFERKTRPATSVAASAAAPPRRGTRADGEATRARILEAAGQLFAATGYAETTSKAIAAEAGVDLASINYHFGHRTGLYQRVLAEAHRRVISLDDLQRIAASPLPARDKLGQFIDLLTQGTAGRSQQWHARLLAREVLAPSSNLQVLFDHELKPKFAVILGILSEITGIPEQDPALLRCMVSIGAPCLMLMVAGRQMPGPPQQLLRMPPQVLTAHLRSFALAGLDAIGREHAERAAPRRATPSRRRRN